jgi:hypothetical protein
MQTPTPETDDLPYQFLFSKYGARLFQQFSSGIVGTTWASAERLLPTTGSKFDWREVGWSRHGGTNSLDNGRVEAGSTVLIVSQDERMTEISR